MFIDFLFWLSCEIIKVVCYRFEYNIQKLDYVTKSQLHEGQTTCKEGFWVRCGQSFYFLGFFVFTQKKASQNL